MADSDDEYDRKRRDKFRGERSAGGGENYRSERREDRGRRDDWPERNPFRGGRGRPDYRDYRGGGGRDRYSPDRLPPPKRMRPDWGDELRGRYAAHDPYGLYGWGGHDSYAMQALHGFGGPHLPAPHAAREAAAAAANSDVQTQPAMLTLKQFLDTQDDGISDSEVLRKYNDYKLDFKRQQLNEFFVTHKDEEWFKNKYHPEECIKRKEEQSSFLQGRVDVFNELLEDGTIPNITIDTNQSDPLLRILDTVVIKLEGGTEEDLKVLDEKPQELKIPERPVDKKIEQDDDVIITGVKQKRDIDDDEENWDDPPPEVKAPAVKKKAIDDGEENWDDDEEEEKAEPVVVDNGNDEEESKKTRKRKRSSSASSNSSSESEKSEKSEKDVKEDEHVEKKMDEEEDEVKADGDDEIKEVEEEEEKKVEVEEEKKEESADESKEDVTENVDEETKVGEEEGEEDKEKVVVPEETEDNTETIDVDKQSYTPAPRALHRTSSIFLRNLAPTITKGEIEAVCKRFDGYLRVAIADPLVERRWFRRGWVTFKRDVNIKEICWNLNNMRLRDCEMGAIVNRDLSRRVRPVNGITAHKTIVRSDIKLCAKIAMNLDEKFQLWIENKQKEDAQDKSNGTFGFKSNNPALQNITDFLIEEASAEEDELLGLSGGENKEASDGELLERDPQLIAVLDKLIMYLRIVHSVDFYNHCEYPYEDEMPNRCGIIHARGPPPQNKVSQGDLQDYMKAFEGKMQTFLAKPTPIEEEELKNLGCKDPEAEVEKFVQANTQELAKDKWLCPLSGKKFKGPDFIRKHIFNKHGEKVDEVRKEVEYFNNYLRDPKRPQLPEHPGNARRAPSDSSSGPPGFRGGSGYPPYGGPPYASYAPPMILPPRSSRGFGGGRRGHGGDFRPLIHYRDLDAPREPIDMLEI